MSKFNPDDLPPCKLDDRGHKYILMYRVDDRLAIRMHVFNSVRAMRRALRFVAPKKRLNASAFFSSALWKPPHDRGKCWELSDVFFYRRRDGKVMLDDVVHEFLHVVDSWRDDRRLPMYYLHSKRMPESERAAILMGLFVTVFTEWEKAGYDWSKIPRSRMRWLKTRW